MIRAARRADIQALRALAVSATVLFHAQTPGWSGGFYGVDIFFVISGFLITGLLSRELAATNGIDLAAFWTRRAWRLLPGAVAVLAVSLVLAATLGPVADLRNSAKDIAAALFYVANYRQASRSVDYFDDGANASPALHFWSLSVEEQFYVFWPLVMLACWRWGKQGKTSVRVMALLVGVASAAAALFWASRSLPDAFFRTEARVWQLAAGAVLALSAAASDPGPRPWRTAAFALGCFCTGASLCGLHQLAPSTTLFSALPVAGCVLIIASRRAEEGLIGRVASSAPVQWLGARSYSIYIWHWPLLVFFSGLAAEHKLGMPFLLIAILAVSEFSYRCVEEPLRHGGGPIAAHLKRMSLLLGSSACVGLVAVMLAYGLSLRPGVDSNTTQSILEAAADTPRLQRKNCSPDWQNDANSDCLFGNGQRKRPMVALIGDSYAQHLIDGLDAAAQDAGWSLLVLVRPSCPPVSATVISEQTGAADKDCGDWNRKILQRLASEQADLVLVSSWEGAARRMGDRAGRPINDQALSLTVWQQGLTEFIESVQQTGSAVVVIPSTPRGRFAELESCLGSQSGAQCPMPRPKATSFTQLTLEAVSALKGIVLLDLTDQFCSKNVCYSQRDGRIIYRDRHHHLTATFSRTKLQPVFRNLLDSRNAKQPPD